MANIIRTASVWLKIALASMALGLVLYTIGFATNSWMVSSYQRHYNGLWQYYTCYRGCGSHTYVDNNAYHHAIQAMECIGYIGFFLGIITLLLYFLADSCRRRDFLQATTAFVFAGILFTCIGYAIFGSNENRENIRGFGLSIGWSMGIAIAGTVCYGIAGIMLILQLIGR